MPRTICNCGETAPGLLARHPPHDPHSERCFYYVDERGAGSLVQTHYTADTRWASGLGNSLSSPWTKVNDEPSFVVLWTLEGGNAINFEHRLFATFCWLLILIDAPADWFMSAARACTLSCILLFSLTIILHGHFDVSTESVNSNPFNSNTTFHCLNAPSFA